MTENRARSEDAKQTSSPETTPQNVVDQIFGKSPQSNQQERSNLEVAIFLLTRPVSICILAGLFLTIFIAVLFPSGKGAGILFVWGVIILAIILARWIKAPRPKTAEEKGKMPFWLWLCLAAVAAPFSRHMYNDRSHLNSVAPSMPAQQRAESQKSTARANANHRYWRAAIEAPHSHRFWFVDDENEIADNFYTRHLDGIRQAISYIEQVQTANVDQDLANLSHSLHKTDKEMVELMNRIVLLVKDNPKYRMDDTIGQQRERDFELINQLLSDPSLIETIPDPEVRGIFTRMIEIDNGRFDRFIEVIAMQARLQERYPGFRFALPE